MKRVLFLVNGDIVIYNFRLELVERLLKDGYEVWISSPYGERIEELKKMGCKYVKTDIARHGTNVFVDLKLISHYKKIIKEIKPDIIFGYTIKPNIYGAMAAQKFNVPFVANITGLGTAVENGGIIQKITVMLYKKAFKNIKRVFFQNEENRKFFVDRKIAIDKHAMLPGSGVNLKKFIPLEYPCDDKIRFTFVGRVMKEKGIDQYLEAAKVIREKYPNTEFSVCGFCEAEYKGKLQEYADAGIVIYHGLVKDIREIHKGLHCLVHPSYYPEGLSNALLEACASAKPIITTDRSGCREVIDDGINGFIVNQRDTEDLILKIEKFINLSNEEKREMGLAGRKKVEAEFDRQIVVEKYIEELK